MAEGRDGEREGEREGEEVTWHLCLCMLSTLSWGSGSEQERGRGSGVLFPPLPFCPLLLPHLKLYTFSLSLLFYSLFYTIICCPHLSTHFVSCFLLFSLLPLSIFPYFFIPSLVIFTTTAWISSHLFYQLLLTLSTLRFYHTHLSLQEHISSQTD